MHFNTFTRPLLLRYKALCDTYKKNAQNMQIGKVIAILKTK